MVLTAENTLVFEQFLVTRSPESREQMVLQSVPLVHYLIGRLGFSQDMGSEYEDLVHQGLLGLIEAVDRFDPSHGTRFSTYAGHRIRGRVLDYLRAADWMSRPARQRVRQIQKAVANLWLEYQREPTEDEIASHLGLELDAVQQGLLDSNRVLLSLDAMAETDQDGESSLHERVADEDQPDPSSLLEEEHLRSAMAGAIRKLPEREQLILSLYYHDELTFKEIGKVLNITESRVCQLHSRAILHLKAVMSHE